MLLFWVLLEAKIKRIKGTIIYLDKINFKADFIKPNYHTFSFSAEWRSGFQECITASTLKIF
jgi:hypothetical protein